jgi:hypothetical protein
MALAPRLPLDLRVIFGEVVAVVVVVVGWSFVVENRRGKRQRRTINRLQKGRR